MTRLFTLGAPARRQRARRRPLVVVEDHLYHIDRLLDLIADGAPEVKSLLGVVCLDRPGPDTDRAVDRWLRAHPSLLLAACPHDANAHREAPWRDRFVALDTDVFAHPGDCCRAVASVLRPGGLLVQDVQLETLTFIPRDRWWESIFLASAIRGTFGDRSPATRFLSNKRGYAATFGGDLLDAGFDPRDVLDKDEIDKVLLPVWRRFRRRVMPFDLRAIERGAPSHATCVADADRPAVEAALDLVLWPTDTTWTLGGRAIAAGTTAGKRIRLKPGCPEGVTWCALFEDRFGPHVGIPVLDVGARVAPERAGRAEITNCAARHVHTLRSRLRNADGVCTVDHAYRLGQDLSVGLVTHLPQPPKPLPRARKVVE